MLCPWIMQSPPLKPIFLSRSCGPGGCKHTWALTSFLHLTRCKGLPHLIFIGLANHIKQEGLFCVNVEIQLRRVSAYSDLYESKFKSEVNVQHRRSTNASGLWRFLTRSWLQLLWPAELQQALKETFWETNVALNKWKHNFWLHFFICLVVL